MKYYLTYLFIFSFAIFQGQAYLNEIKSQSDFDRLASIPLSEKYSNVFSVKVVGDANSGSIYFVNSKSYKFHYDFCNRILGDYSDIPLFNHNNYGASSSRDYFLATINYYKDAGIFTLEFSTSEILSEANIEFFNKIKQLVDLEDELNLFPTEEKQINFMNTDFPEVEIVTADYIYGNQKYQALNNTFSYGYLRFIAIDSLDKIQKNDIVIINGTPLEMPFCRGIISTDFQPPLSHIVLLSHNRKNPIMALKYAWENEELRALEGKLVKLVVSNSSYSVEKTENKFAVKYWERNSHKKIKKLKADFDVRGIQSLSSLSSKSVDIVGGKAANFGELNRVYIDENNKVTIPKAAFAIPFSHYYDHVQQRGIQLMIDELISDESIIDNQTLLASKLKKIRKAIVSAPLDKWLLNDVKSIIKQNGIPRLRFRSSTNAEDIEGFNGAGLYDSKTGILNDEKKSVEKAIKKVWASLWNLRAFQEREFFGIDQTSIAMGILVHQSFPNEEANGVAITKNIYRPDRTGFIVNIQKGDVSIVLPPSGVTSELFIIKQNIKLLDQVEVDYVSYSNLNTNKPLLSLEEIKELNEILAAIKQHFYLKTNFFSRPSYNDFALDVEFKIEEGSRRIVVKQVRVY